MAAKIIRGGGSGAGKRFAVVAAQWNSFFTDRLLEGAVDALLHSGVKSEDLVVVRVPGSYEVPFAVKEVALSGKFHGVVALGVLIRGETDHYDLIAKEVTSGIAKAMSETGVPVTFGVITVENQEQAMARCGSKAGNKGSEAAHAAVEMANLKERLRAELSS